MKRLIFTIFTSVFALLFVVVIIRVGTNRNTLDISKTWHYIISTDTGNWDNLEAFLERYQNALNGLDWKYNEIEDSNFFSQTVNFFQNVGNFLLNVSLCISAVIVYPAYIVGYSARVTVWIYKIFMYLLT